VTALIVAIVTFALVFGGALLGMYFRNALSEDHLREDVRDVIKLSTGLIGTMAALVLGLLIATFLVLEDLRRLGWVVTECTPSPVTQWADLVRQKICDSCASGCGESFFFIPACDAATPCASVAST
jgi:O-antigen/teichoic acid export membrane protein